MRHFQKSDIRKFDASKNLTFKSLTQEIEEFVTKDCDKNVNLKIVTLKQLANTQFYDTYQISYYFEFTRRTFVPTVIA